MPANTFDPQPSADLQDGVVALGDALRIYRVKRRLTQAELVDLLKANQMIEVDQAYISRVERNEIRPRRPRLEAICSELECTLAEVNALAGQLVLLSRRRDAINNTSAPSTRRPTPNASENLSAYQTATLAAHIGIWRFDFAARVIWLSVSSKALVDPNVLSSEWKDYVLASDHQSVRRAVLAALRSGCGDFECYARLRSPDGTPRMFRIAGKIERGSGRRALSLSGAIMPVSDQQCIAMYAIDAIRGSYIFAKDRNLLFTFVNRALVEAFGKKSKGELIGKTDRDIHPHADEVRFFNEMDRAAISLLDQRTSNRTDLPSDNHRLAINEEFFTDSKGHRRVLATVKEPILMPNNEIQIFGIATDVTEYHRLKASFDHLMNYVGDTGDVIYFKDDESRFIRANRAMASLAGVSEPGEMVGKRDHDFFPAEYADEWRKEEQQVFSSGIPSVNKVCRNQMPDGSITWRMVSKYPVTDSDGKVCELIGIAKDITELVVARDRLRFESQLFDQVVNSDKVMLCIWVKDVTGRYIKSNQQFATRHGYRDAAMIIGKTDFDHWPRAIAESYRHDDNFVVYGKSAKLCYQERQHWEDGKESLILTSKIPVLDSDGCVVAILGMYEVLQESPSANDASKVRPQQAKNRMTQSLKQIELALSNQGLCMGM